MLWCYVSHCFQHNSRQCRGKSTQSLENAAFQSWHPIASLSWLNSWKELGPSETLRCLGPTMQGVAWIKRNYSCCPSPPPFRPHQSPLPLVLQWITPSKVLPGFIGPSITHDRAGPGTGVKPAGGCWKINKRPCSMAIDWLNSPHVFSMRTSETEHPGLYFVLKNWSYSNF